MSSTDHKTGAIFCEKRPRRQLPYTFLGRAIFNQPQDLGGTLSIGIAFQFARAVRYRQGDKERGGLFEVRHPVLLKKSDWLQVGHFATRRLLTTSHDQPIDDRRPILAASLQNDKVVKRVELDSIPWRTYRCVMEGKDIAPALIEALSSQSTILSTMGLAVLGGLLAFSMQIIFHNHSESSRPIRVGKMISVWVCAGCVVITVFLGYFISGAIVSALPILFNSTYAPDKALHENAIERLDVIRYLSLAQFVFFLAGAIALVWFVASNLRLMRN